MTTVSHETLLSAVEEMATLLAADGVSLRVLALDEDSAGVELAADFDDVDCEECVLPPDRLRETVLGALARGTGRTVGLVLHDAREPLATAAASISDTPARWTVVLDPTGVAPEDGVPDPGPDAGPLQGKVVAVRCDILWQSFDWTIEEWSERFREAGATVLLWRRVQGLVGVDYERAQAEYESMLSRADVVISGLGNCGSCTYWTVRDALTAAGRGLPTVAVATEHFAPLAELLAADGGRPGLRLAVLPYPFDPLGEDDVRAAARERFPRLLEVLGASV
jgi:uncharacterized protein YigA (DUF484 family)